MSEELLEAGFKLLPPEDGQPAGVVQRLSDGAFIPKDPRNNDYKMYLQWVDEGGVAEEADED